VCPWNARFAEVAAESDYAAREAWEAEWRDEDVSAETSGTRLHRMTMTGRVPTPSSPPPTGPRSSICCGCMRTRETATRGDRPCSGRVRRAGAERGHRIGKLAGGDGSPDPEAVGELVAALSDEDPVVAEAGGYLGRTGVVSAGSSGWGSPDRSSW
jgi:hypothetical protein